MSNNMKCPSCDKQAITFSAWGSGINAFRTQCMNCGVKLKGNKVVVWGFTLTMSFVTATIVLVIASIKPGADDGVIRFVTCAVPAAIGVLIVYRLGGYDRVEK